MFRTIVVVTLFLTSFGLAQQKSWILTLKNGDQLNDIVPYNVDQGSLILLQDGPFFLSLSMILLSFALINRQPGGRTEPF